MDKNQGDSGFLGPSLCKLRVLYLSKFAKFSCAARATTLGPRCSYTPASAIDKDKERGTDFTNPTLLLEMHSTSEDPPGEGNAPTSDHRLETTSTSLTPAIDQCQLQKNSPIIPNECNPPDPLSHLNYLSYNVNHEDRIPFDKITYRQARAHWHTYVGYLLSVFPYHAVLKVAQIRD